MHKALSQIANFGSKDMAKFIRGQDCPLTRKLNAEKVALRAYRVITILNSTNDLKDLNEYKGMKHENLLGEWKGFCSIRLNEKWRLVFRVDAHTGQYSDVDINAHYE